MGFRVQKAPCLDKTTQCADSGYAGVVLLKHIRSIYRPATITRKNDGGINGNNRRARSVAPQ